MKTSQVKRGLQAEIKSCRISLALRTRSFTTEIFLYNPDLEDLIYILVNSAVEKKVPESSAIMSAAVPPQR